MFFVQELSNRPFLLCEPTRTIHLFFISLLKNRPLCIKVIYRLTELENFLFLPLFFKHWPIFPPTLASQKIPLLDGMLNPCKSVGSNGLPISLLKIVGCSISQLLTLLTYQSFQSGIYPDKFQTTKVISFHKRKC